MFIQSGILFESHGVMLEIIPFITEVSKNLNEL